MQSERNRPGDIASALARRSRASRGGAGGGPGGGAGGMWKRETFTLPRADARAKAREWFDHFPKAAYMTEIEFWRELPDGQIEFTIRRLPTAD
ncbi:MAG: hypothetical protein FJX29_01440 [Alphaproteobacteria bacterium]|nr:hypothetical protein [Alphaproteobacteria bacterium]